MAKILSLDPGSSFMKACALGGSPIAFASFVAPSAGQTGIRVGGTWWSVGDDALDQMRTPESNPHEGAEYHGSTHQYVAVCEAVRRLQESSYDRMVIGLPYFLQMGGERAQAARKRIGDTYRSIAWQDSQGEHKVEIKSITIAPQGGGALWEHVNKHPEMAGKLACCIDVGGHTSDIVTAWCSATLGQERIVQPASQSLPANVAQFYGWLVDRLAAMPGASLRDKHFDYQTLMRQVAAQDFKVRHKGREYGIEECVRDVQRDFTSHVLGEAQRAVGVRWDDLAVIVFTGGGACLLDRALLSDERIVIADPLANARGQLLLNQERKARHAENTVSPQLAG